MQFIGLFKLSSEIVHADIHFFSIIIQIGNDCMIKIVSNRNFIDIATVYKISRCIFIISLKEIGYFSFSRSKNIAIFM